MYGSAGGYASKDMVKRNNTFRNVNNSDCSARFRKHSKAVRVTSLVDDAFLNTIVLFFLCFFSFKLFVRHWE